MSTALPKDTTAMKFDMAVIGRTIARLRKQADLTQMGLADRLGISYQAVSNWERGQSMPDISKLSELSQILGASIDDILGNEKYAGVVKRIQQDEKQVELLDKEEVKAVAPLLKPSQVERAVEPLRDDLDGGDIAILAPFMDTRWVDEWGEQLYGQEGNIKAAATLAPFLSHELLASMASRALEEERGFNAIAPLLPFLSTAYVDCLALNHAKSQDLEGIAPLAPFMSAEKLDELAEDIVAKDGIGALSALAPFLKQETLDAYAMNSFEEAGLKGIQILVPFLGKETLAGIARATIKKNGLRSVMPLAPFLDMELLSEFIRGMGKE